MLEDPPLLTIKRSWHRIPPEVIARFDGAQTGHLGDAMNGRGALDAAIKPVVSKAHRFIGSAVCGDILAGLAKNVGCSAIVIDGAARDLEGLEAIGLPVFARTITPNSCVKTGPGSVGLPVAIGNVVVSAGDLVFGDRDGVIVVPHAQVATVADRVAAIRAAEAKVIAEVEGGLTGLAFMTALLETDRVRFVD
ncbi:MAG: RraA family protein [Hyphomicrobiaceae bacterium]